MGYPRSRLVRWGPSCKCKRDWAVCGFVLLTFTDVEGTLRNQTRSLPHSSLLLPVAVQTAKLRVSQPIYSLLQDKNRWIYRDECKGTRPYGLRVSWQCLQGSQSWRNVRKDLSGLMVQSHLYHNTWPWRCFWQWYIAKVGEQIKKSLEESWRNCENMIRSPNWRTAGWGKK